MTYSPNRWTTTSVSVRPSPLALSVAAFLRSSGMRNPLIGVFGWFGISARYRNEFVGFVGEQSPLAAGEHDLAGLDVLDDPGLAEVLDCGSLAELGGHLGGPLKRCMNTISRCAYTGQGAAA